MSMVQQRRCRYGSRCDSPYGHCLCRGDAEDVVHQTVLVSAFLDPSLTRGVSAKLSVLAHSAVPPNHTQGWE